MKKTSLFFEVLISIYSFPVIVFALLSGATVKVTVDYPIKSEV